MPGRTRCRCNDAPAGLGSARFDRRGKPHQQPADAGLAGFQRKPPRRRQIERLVRPPHGGAAHLADDGGKAGAGKPGLERPQRLAGPTRRDLDDAPRIKPQRRQTGGIKRARLAAAAGLADPQNVGGPVQQLAGRLHRVAGGRILLGAEPRHKRQRKATGGRFVPAFRGADFVQRGARQTAAQNGVQRRQAKRKTLCKASRRQYRTTRLPRNCIGILAHAAFAGKSEPVGCRQPAFDTGNVAAQTAKHPPRRGGRRHGDLFFVKKFYLCSY